MNKDNLSYVFGDILILETDNPENVTITKNTQLKTCGKLSLFIFLTLYQQLGSKGAKVYVLLNISPDHSNQAESSKCMLSHQGHPTRI